MARPRRWEFNALDPLDPDGIRIVNYWIDQATIENLTTHVLGARWFRILCVKDVLEKPDAVFEGWGRDGFSQARCYVGRPYDRPSEGVEISPKAGRSFLVFVLPSGKMEEWRWETFDPDSTEDCRKQFGENWRQIWPPTAVS